MINEAIFLEQCITIATTAPVYQGESVAAFYLSRSLAASYSAIPILQESRFDPSNVFCPVSFKNVPVNGVLPPRSKLALGEEIVTFSCHAPKTALVSTHNILTFALVVAL